MSLIRQLWLVILALLLLTYGASIVIGLTGSRQYMMQQLEIKNSDNANALALTMSQLDKEPVSLELLVSAQFDTGFYRFIELRDPEGNLMIERRAMESGGSAPDWFVELVDFSVPPGEALIQDGWRQYATLELQSQQRYAWDALWETTLRLTGWFALAAVISLALMAWLVGYIRRPLQAVIEQARAIGQRRFSVIDEPRTRELREVVREMNRLSFSVRQMLEQDSASIERLRYRLQHDALTGALSRDAFMDRLETSLHRDDPNVSGTLALVRIGNLEALNAAIGYTGTDRVLQRLGQGLIDISQRHDGSTGRLNGGDLALLLPGVDHHEKLALELSQLLDEVVGEEDQAHRPQLSCALCGYDQSDVRSTLLARLDGALASAEIHQGSENPHIPRICRHLKTPLYNSRQQWFQALDQALDSGFTLAAYPVRDRHDAILHFEAPSRLYLDGDWQSAALFMPWIRRLDLDARLDLAAVRHALARLAQDNAAISINISVVSIVDARFVQHLRDMLKSHRHLATRLWLELPETVLLHHRESFRAFCRALQPLGCRIGLEHVGHRLNSMADLHDMGMHFIKLDAALVRALGRDGEHRTVLRGLVAICHSLGITAIAEGVMTAEEREQLFELGLDAVTGPGVS